MRKILAVLIVAGLLALLLSVPAMAGSSNPPDAFGQAMKGAVQLVHPWGAQVVWRIGDMRADTEGWYEARGVENFGDWVEDCKLNAPGS